MTNFVPIQSLYTSDGMNNSICSFDVEVFPEPTAPLIHPMSRLCLVNGGTGTVLINNKEYFLKKGSVVSVLPWQITDIVEVKEPLQFYVVAYHFVSIHRIVNTFFNLDNVNLSFMQELKAAPVVTFEEEKYKEVQNMFHQLRDELHSANEKSGKDKAESAEIFSNVYVTNKLIEILMSVLRSDRSGGDASEDDNDILGFMYTHLSEKITIPLLAQKFYMSESAVRSYIKKTTGLSFSNLLNEMRVGKMVNYLLYTDFTVEELAKILGFTDDAHVCKIFKARMGMKVNEFRNIYQMTGERCHIRDGKVGYEIVEYIYRNHTEDLTLQSVSQYFQVSPKVLNRVLSHKVEKNFNEFLNFVRVNHASELLLETDKSVLTIALEVGYKIEKTLSRNFLQIRGMTTGEFRRTVELQKMAKNTEKKAENV